VAPAWLRSAPGSRRRPAGGLRDGHGGRAEFVLVTLTVRPLRPTATRVTTAGARRKIARTVASAITVRSGSAILDTPGVRQRAISGLTFTH
jgi:hypothetical protein